MEYMFNETMITGQDKVTILSIKSIANKTKPINMNASAL